MLEDDVPFGPLGISPLRPREDAEGRVIGLHALRTTLGTMLARHGAKPQVARQIMRHSDYKTTLKHYTVLGLDDTAGAINQLPYIGASQRNQATGTAGATTRNTARNARTKECDIMQPGAIAGAFDDGSKPNLSDGSCKTM